MDIVFYKIGTPESISADCVVVQVSDILFSTLAKSDFSQLGESRKAKIDLDGEVVELRLVKLTKIIRQALITFLSELVIDTLQDSFSHLGDSPSPSEYREYTSDLKTILEIIQYFRDTSFTHFNRTGD